MQGCGARRLLAARRGGGDGGGAGAAATGAVQARECEGAGGVQARLRLRAARRRPKSGTGRRGPGLRAAGGVSPDGGGPREPEREGGRAAPAGGGGGGPEPAAQTGKRGRGGVHASAPEAGDAGAGAGTRTPGATPPLPLARSTRYRMKDGSYTCRGEAIGGGDFHRYMRERVGPRHRDDAGRAVIERELEEIASAGFDDGVRAGLLSTSRPLHYWRVGESLAECYMEDCEGAAFPYPSQRDEKNPSASAAGADLVGYSTDGSGTTFLFAEVKTTRDKSRPPSAAWKLGGQLEELRRRRGTSLVRWLVLKAGAGGAERDERRRNALASYGKGRLRIAGVLVSDRDPDKRDLDGLFGRLTAGPRGGERLDLVALYLPVQVGQLGDLAGEGR